ncbi:MAG: anti-sigma factor [Daejeonella sp.]
MGDLTPAERAEVEEMSAKHPEIKSEIASIEVGLENYAKTYAVNPSDALRSKVLNQISPQNKTETVQETKVVEISQSGSSLFYKYAFAASLALLVMSIAALFVLNNKLQESNQQLAVLQSSNQQFSNRVNYMTEQLDKNKEALAILHNPEVKMVKLAGTKNAPKASMMVAFNPVKNEVMIDMKMMQMPENDDQHQYQLWALVDGKPVDLGVFDKQDNEDGMKKMKTISYAQAFAVTLEPKGGSVNPTMEQMMVMGAI